MTSDIGRAAWITESRRRVADQHHRAELEAAFARGYRLGFRDGADAVAEGLAEEAVSLEQARAEGYREAVRSNDSLYHSSYLDACSDNAAVIAKLKARIAELEDAA